MVYLSSLPGNGIATVAVVQVEFLLVVVFVVVLLVIIVVTDDVVKMLDVLWPLLQMLILYLEPGSCTSTCTCKTRNNIFHTQWNRGNGKVILREEIFHVEIKKST